MLGRIKGVSIHDTKDQSSLKMIVPSVEKKTQKRASVFRPFRQNENIIPLQPIMSDLE